MSVRRNGTLIARYGYDVQGRRIVKRVYSSVSGGTVGYLRMNYGGSQVAFETDSMGNTLLTRYTWGPGTDQLVSLRAPDGTHYVAVTDALGSVRALVKRDGTWAGRLRYDPYGNLVDSAGTQPALRYRWTGREWDAETGFYFHRTRYFDPQAQRFVQEDKIGYAGSGNLYAYVSGAVLQARDPDGLRKRHITAGGGGWGYMCLGIDICFSGFGELSGGPGGTWGERQAASLMAWGNAAELVYLKRQALETEVTISFTDASGNEVTQTFRIGDLNATTQCAPCQFLPAGSAVYAGVAFDAASPIGGFTFAFGHFLDRAGWGEYNRIGVAAGLDLSAGMEVGFASSFRGSSGSLQVGLLEVSGTLTGSAGGSLSVSASVGLSLFPLSVSGTYTYTSASYSAMWSR